ncbi:hypothetical protein A3Q56_03563 [Intoshia linei]|uniref:ER membrane protein complex subunit 10 n=1 Tax=Intoshia linei TaxID=1819745 RepID=A0A177B520_9BILA|nr:hypothetical protein A3Q56_03563 [Intoshia linei]
MKLEYLTLLFILIPMLVSVDINLEHCLFNIETNNCQLLDANYATIKKNVEIMQPEQLELNVDDCAKYIYLLKVKGSNIKTSQNLCRYQRNNKKYDEELQLNFNRNGNLMAISLSHISDKIVKKSDIDSENSFLHFHRKVKINVPKIISGPNIAAFDKKVKSERKKITENPQDNRMFIVRYWYVCLPVFIILCIGSLVENKPDADPNR